MAGQKSEDRLDILKGELEEKDYMAILQRAVKTRREAIEQLKQQQ